jgi:tetratricopeptide (TPR) repeat protein
MIRRCRVPRAGCRVPCRVPGASCRVPGAGCRVPGAGCRVPRAGCLVLCAILCTSPASAALTETPRLAAVYDAILNARFDQAEAQLKQACPPAPEGACLTLRVVSLWWQISIDPESRALDPRFSALAASTIAANEAWTRREPQRAEAWFYLAGAYAPRVQWEVLRGERLSAARDGKRIKDALERALQLDPTLNDAYFGIGLYHYYADVAPAAAKVLRWLLFLPGGDRAMGLREMLQGRDKGELLRGEADFQLHIVYLWYEHKTEDALNLLARLDARYPNNPLFLEQSADIRDRYLHDHAASAAAWRSLVARAVAGTVYSARTTEVRARLGLASELAAMNRPADAIDELQRVVDMQPIEPIGARERAERELRAATARKERR